MPEIPLHDLHCSLIAFISNNRSTIVDDAGVDAN